VTAFLDRLRTELNDRIAARNAAKQAMDAMLDAIDTEGRSELSADEVAQLDEHRSAILAIDADIEQRQARVAELDEIERRQHVAAAVPGTNVRVRSEEPTYHRGNAATRSFFVDAWSATRGDSEARERMARNAAEVRATGVETRDVTTAAFGALVVPQYLTDLYASFATAGRPLANAVSRLPLPAAGMSVLIPRGTTPSGVALQANENDAVQETDMDETTLTVSVRTFAGQQDVSRQALERGEMIDEIVFADLAAQYAARLDSHIISHGTDGILSIGSVDTTAYTDASPTVAELVPKVFDSINEVASNRFLPPTLIVMHPRRWSWICAAADTAGRPLVVPNAQAPQNAAGVGTAAAYGSVGTFCGLPVLTDANIPTTRGAGSNEDVIIVTRVEDLILMEQSPVPRQLRFEDVGSGTLTVKMVAFGYAAFAAGRYPRAVSLVGGTGLVPPAF